MPSRAAIERARRLERLPMQLVGGGRRSSRPFMSKLTEILHRRELLGLLVRRELKARYKDSSFGILWSLVRPLAQFLVYYFALGQVLGLARAIPNFAIFVFVGLSVWTLFTEIINNSTTSITGNAGLIKKVFMPREVFPLAAVGGALFNYAVQLLVLFVAMLATQSFPIGTSLAYFPFALALTMTWAIAFGLILAAVNVYMRDIQHLTEVALIILFWASPIVYAFHFVHSKVAGTFAETLYTSNPITLGVLGMQRALWRDGSEQAGVTNFPDHLAMKMGLALLIGLVFLYFAERVFSRLQANFAQEL